MSARPSNEFFFNEILPNSADKTSARLEGQRVVRNLAAGSALFVILSVLPGYPLAAQPWPDYDSTNDYSRVASWRNDRSPRHDNPVNAWPDAYRESALTNSQSVGSSQAIHVPVAGHGGHDGRGDSGTVSSAPRRGEYDAPGNLALRQMGWNKLPKTRLDSFVRNAGAQAETIYGNEGTNGPPPFKGFDTSHRINAGILDDRAQGLTTKHGWYAPNAWGADEFINGPYGEWSYSGSASDREPQSLRR